MGKPPMCFISPMPLCFLFLWNRCWIQGLILPEIFLWLSAPKLYTEGYVLNAFRPFLFLAVCELFCLQEFSPLALLCVAFCDHCSVWPSLTIALCDLLWPLTPMAFRDCCPVWLLSPVDSLWTFSSTTTHGNPPHFLCDQYYFKLELVVFSFQHYSF